MPAIDCVMFADPKQSRIDIVQAAGRALRLHKEKEYGYIVVPLVVPEDMDFETFAETTAFRQVAQTLTALSTQDERIADEFRAIEKGRVSSGKIVEIEGDVPVGMKMKLGDFAEAISTRIWEKRWTRELAVVCRSAGVCPGIGVEQSCGMVEMDNWAVTQANLPEMPPDIPAGPDRVYSENWKDWADWLGHSRRIGGWRPFNEARKYARKLKLGSHKDWTALANVRTSTNRHRLPDDIPSYPNNVYEEWIGWWDWLGTGHRRGRWLSFSSARALSRKLGLTSEAQFIRWRRGLLKHRVKCPVDMPMHPDRVYPQFKGWPDFLGFTPRTWMPFDQARKFVRRLRLERPTRIS